MQRISKWGGLVTQASPYAIPPGGAQQQVNFTLSKPGQLTSRGGMREMKDPTNSGGSGHIEQMWTVASGAAGKSDAILTLNDDGELYLLPGLA
jgi:hypothetical protein